jgi:hypothetical protein
METDKLLAWEMKHVYLQGAGVKPIEHCLLCETPTKRHRLEKNNVTKNRRSVVLQWCPTCETFVVTLESIQ